MWIVIYLLMICSDAVKFDWEAKLFQFDLSAIFDCQCQDFVQLSWIDMNYIK